jgi:2'-hydroxyisoflavone reductase
MSDARTSPAPQARYAAPTDHTGPVVAAGQDWLIAHDIQPWMGERSVPLWLQPGP